MEHYEVADMFGRRQNPRLSVYLTAVRARTGHHETQLELGLVNKGRAIAKHPALRIVGLEGIFSVSPYGIDGNGAFGLKALRSEKGHCNNFRGGSDFVVYPGAPHAICIVRASVTEQLYPPDDLALDLTTTVMAESMRVRQQRIIIENAEVNDLIWRTGGRPPAKWFEARDV